MRKNIALILLALILLLTLTACGDDDKDVTYADGTYTAQSSVFVNDDGTDDGNGYGVVTITIEGGVVTACEFATYEENGNLKDENYGKEGGEVANRDYFNKAQKAVKAVEKYAERFVENGGKVKKLDVISGATVNHDEFVEAATAALKEAQVKEQ